MAAEAPRPQTSNPPVSRLAYAALVLAIVLWPIGLVLGIVALIRINQSRGQLGGKNIAIAAIAIPTAMIPIAGILGAIAYPSFARYQYRAKASEARAILMGLIVAEDSYRTEHDTYLRALPNPSSAPTDKPAPWENRPCSPECKPDNPSACLEFSCFDYKSEQPVRYRYACEATAATADAPGELVCAAVGDLDGDGKLAAFVYGTSNKKGTATVQAPLPALAKELCPREIPANQVFECRPGEN